MTRHDDRTRLSRDTPESWGGSRPRDGSGRLCQEVTASATSGLLFGTDSVTGAVRTSPIPALVAGSGRACKNGGVRYCLPNPGIPMGK